MSWKPLYLALALAGVVTLAACAGTPSATNPVTPDAASVPGCPPPAAMQASAQASAGEPTPAPIAKPVAQVQEHAPFRYVVQPGDTLWDISGRFFRSPWLWPEIWYENPYIQNPHLIYPGDVITFTYVNGQPALLVSRHGTVVAATTPEVRMLHPTVEHIPLAEAIPTIPFDEIAPLLSRPRIMMLERYKAAPYILRALNGSVIVAAPKSVYARDLDKNAVTGTEYVVVRKKQPLVDPATGELLGYEVLHLGRAVVTSTGDPATLKLTESNREIHAGDRLIPVERGIVPTEFPLRIPCAGMRATVIDVLGSIIGAGQYQVVVLNRGETDGLRVGAVLEVQSDTQTVRDPYAHGELSTRVKLPRRPIGELVVFRTFDEASYALVMHATRPIKEGALATSP